MVVLANQEAFSAPAQSQPVISVLIVGQAVDWSSWAFARNAMHSATSLSVSNNRLSVKLVRQVNSCRRNCTRARHVKLHRWNAIIAIFSRVLRNTRHGLNGNCWILADCGLVRCHSCIGAVKNSVSAIRSLCTSWNWRVNH
ncbi:Uncharacterised protein [Chlamydia trachomatis]|nr:Uncharacterised protein [Chlamydia trachomatis]